MSSNINYTIIIPTYNNCGTIKEVIDKCGEHTENIIVVNDGSTDNTQSILDAYPDIKCIIFSENRGKGAALKAGLRKAFESGFDYAITIDSDGQHFPEEIPVFLEAAQKEPATLWVGSRNLTAENMSGNSTFANKFSNFWFKAETGITLTDTQSGYRLYPLKSISELKLFSGKYEFELEVLVKAAWKGVPVKNIPITVFYPPKNERITHFRPSIDFFRISVLNTVLVLYALLWYWPFRFFRWFNKKNIKRFVHDNITHSKESNIKIATSLGMGIFFGIVPLWGYQMLTAVFAAHLLKLNKVLVLVASNISIPPMIPFILWGSFATGAYVMNIPIDLIPENLTLGSIAESLKQYLIGSIIFAIVCGLAVTIISYLVLLIIRKPAR